MILKILKVKTQLEEPTNCYVVEDDKTKETMVIDPGGEPEKIIYEIPSPLATADKTTLPATS